MIKEMCSIINHNNDFFSMNKKKILHYWPVPMAIKLKGEGGGGKALMAWPLVEDFFCGFPIGRAIYLYCHPCLSTGSKDMF